MMWRSACAVVAIIANRSWSKSCRETECLLTSGSLTSETSCGWLEKRCHLFQVANNFYCLQLTSCITMLKTGSLVLSAGQLQAPVGRELVLDYIIERKRIDDLCGSIIDGRFREQKVGVCHRYLGCQQIEVPCLCQLLWCSYCSVQFRLKRCGLRKPIYLVELHGNAASHLSLPETTLQQALVNTQVWLLRSPIKGAEHRFQCYLIYRAKVLSMSSHIRWSTDSS